MGIVISKDLKKYSIINGLVLGAALLAFNIISFYLITTIIKSPLGVIGVPYLLNLILPIPCAIIVVYKLRVQMKWEWNFRIATSGIFIMFLASYIVINIGRDLIFAHLVEPNMGQKIEQTLLEATPVALKKANATDKQIADKEKEISEQFKAQSKVTVGQQIESHVIYIILLFVVALVFGALFQKPSRSYDAAAINNPQ
jgi:hypothetical protein